MTRDGADQKGMLRAAWRHKGFRYLFTSFVVSGAGDMIFTIALVAYVFEQTQSAGWVGLAATVRIVPFAAFGSVGGVIAGRYDRRRLMIALDVTRAVVMGCMALAASLDAAALVLIALAFCSNTASTPYSPAVAATTPEVVPEDDLGPANALNALGGQLIFLVGPAIGAALFAILSASAAFLVNCTTFVVSAIVVSRLRSSGDRAASAAAAPRDGTDGSPGGDAAAPAEGTPSSSWVEEWRQGLTSTVRTPGVSVLTGLLLAVLLAYGFETVLYTLVTVERLGLGPEAAGYLFGATGVGGLLLAPLSGRFAVSERPGLLLTISGVMLGVPLALLSVVSSLPVAIALLFVEGVGMITFEVVFATLLQRLAKAGDLARISGFQDSASATAMVVGTVLAPLLVSLVSLEVALVAGGGLLILVATLLGPRLVAVGETTVARSRDLRPRVERLGGLGLFDGVSVAALERLATSVTVEEVASGSIVLREGDPPDDVFVVIDGVLHVEAATALQPIPDLAPGDWFGEIGLVHQVPRTATVSAGSAATLWRLPGAAFLDAVTAPAGVNGPLQQGIGLRLSRTHSGHIGTTS